MTRLLALFAGLLGVLLVPLALSAPTAWLLLVPAHLGLVGVTSLGAVLDGLAGRPEQARRWGLAALVATVVMFGALELGARSRGEALGYWGLPWVCGLCAAWIPPVIAGGMGVAGVAQGRRLTRRAIRARRSPADQEPNSDS